MKFGVLGFLKRFWLPTLYGVLLVVWVFFYPVIEPWLELWFPLRGRTISRSPLTVLVRQHIVIAGVATTFAVFTALLLGVIVRLSRSEELRQLVLAFSAIGETIPSAAVIALAVPIIGYGNGPCILALYLYGILPVVRNVIVGFEGVLPAIEEAGVGMGMTPWQMLWRVDFPLAMPAILTGIRVALVINISAATIGATVGAGGLGVVIISGIRIRDALLVIQGSIPVVLLALMADGFLSERKLTKS